MYLYLKKDSLYIYYMESKIFLGPMSRNIVDTVIEYSNSFTPFLI